MVIRTIFLERLSHLNLAEKESTEYKTRLNRLINDAINNMLRPKVSYFLQDVIIQTKIMLHLFFQVMRHKVVRAKFKSMAPKRYNECS